MATLVAPGYFEWENKAMIIKKIIPINQEITINIICDRCKTNIQNNGLEFSELQEMLNIEKECGYGSIFGDGNIYTCDLCQNCVKELLGPYLNIIKEN